MPKATWMRKNKPKVIQPTPEAYLTRDIHDMRSAAIWLEGLAYFFRNIEGCDDWASKVDTVIALMRKNREGKK